VLDQTEAKLRERPTVDRVPTLLQLLIPRRPRCQSARGRLFRAAGRCGYRATRR